MEFHARPRREAQEGGCTNDLWTALAANREKDHPEDVLPIYRRQVESTLDQKNHEAHRAALGLLRKVRALMARLKRDADFALYLESVARHTRPSRIFIKLLERGKWE